MYIILYYIILYYIYKPIGCSFQILYAHSEDLHPSDGMSTFSCAAVRRRRRRGRCRGLGRRVGRDGRGPKGCRGFEFWQKPKKWLANGCHLAPQNAVLNGFEWFWHIPDDEQLSKKPWDLMRFSQTNQEKEYVASHGMQPWVHRMHIQNHPNRVSKCLKWSNGFSCRWYIYTGYQDISFCLRDGIDASCIDNGCKWDISPSEISSAKPKKMSWKWRFCLNLAILEFHDSMITLQKDAFDCGIALQWLGGG